MAKSGRKPKGISIDELPDDVRRDIDLAIESDGDESIRSLYARFGLSQRGLGWAVFEKYAGKMRRAARGRKIEERLASVDDPRTESDLISELRRRCYIEALASLQAGDAKLYEIVSTLSRVFDFDRLQMERAAEKRAVDKHDAWKKEFEKTVRSTLDDPSNAGKTTFSRADVADMVDKIMRGT